jgi:hypothetical protein
MKIFENDLYLQKAIKQGYQIACKIILIKSKTDGDIKGNVQK